MNTTFLGGIFGGWWKKVEQFAPGFCTFVEN
jgi:hypothetical protein